MDLKDAFFCMPLDKQSQGIFAFEWENPQTGQKSQLTWTVLLHRIKNIKKLKFFGTNWQKN